MLIQKRRQSLTIFVVFGFTIIAILALFTSSDHRHQIGGGIKPCPDAESQNLPELESPWMHMSRKILSSDPEPESAPGERPPPGTPPGEGSKPGNTTVTPPPPSVTENPL